MRENQIAAFIDTAFADEVTFLANFSSRDIFIFSAIRAISISHDCNIFMILERYTAFGVSHSVVATREAGRSTDATRIRKRRTSPS